jgi:hypothetical protein
MMKNVFKFLGIIALVVVIGFSMTACGGDDDDGGGVGGSGQTGGSDNGGADTWSKVNNISQVNGTWKAQSTPVTANVQGMNVTTSYSNYTITFNATANTMTVSGSQTSTYSGGDINTYWPTLKQQSLAANNQVNGLTVSANDATHSITTIYNNVSQTVGDLFRAPYQINQNGTKLKVSSGGVEVIFTKQ